MLSTETQALGLQPERSGLHKIYRYGLYAYKRLRVHSPEKAHVFTPRSFIHVIANKTLGRVDPLVGRLRFILQYPQGLKHYLRPAGACLASRSALVPPHLQGRVAVNRAIIP